MQLAWRYLISKKSHSAVGAISAISICGMAVATAAIICVMSVFNGFREAIEVRLNSLSPDVMVTPLKGKTIENADSLADAIQTIPGVKASTPTLSDNALVLFNGHELPIILKGVRHDKYKSIVALDSIIIAADSTKGATAQESIEPAILSIGVASSLKAYPADELTLFTPRRFGRVNLSNPANSFVIDSVKVDKVFRANQSEFDESLVIVDLDLARNLLQYETEASSIEISASNGVSDSQLAQKIRNTLSQNYVVKDRLQQQSNNFKMINIEKWVTFLLLFFILTIASFNIISSLSMLVLEKEQSLATLNALGMRPGDIGGIFVWQSLFVSMIGGGAGIAIGSLLCILQREFGFIKIAGDAQNLIMTSYPVKLIPADILITIIPIAVIAIITALITSAFAKQRIKCSK